MRTEELMELADDNNADKQMDNEQYECLVELIADGTINSVEKLSEYIDIDE